MRANEPQLLRDRRVFPRTVWQPVRQGGGSRRVPALRVRTALGARALVAGTLTARVLLAGALVTIGLSTRLAAQEVSVRAVTLSSDNLLRDTPLWGGNIALRWRPGNGAVAYHLGGEWTSGDRTATGFLCVGIFLPENCASEPVREDARLRSADVGASFRLLSRARASLELSADVLAGSVRRDSRGQTSELSLSAEKRVWGGRAGIESRWQPWAAVPLDLQLGATYGQLGPFTKDEVVDGYTPFNRALHVRRIVIGATWRFSGARP